MSKIIEIIVTTIIFILLIVRHIIEVFVSLVFLFMIKLISLPFNIVSMFKGELK